MKKKSFYCPSSIKYSLRHLNKSIRRSLLKSRLVIIILGVMTGLAACKKDKKDTTLGNTYPKALNAIVTPDILQSLKTNGAVIYDGLTPPTINGIYLFQPSYCTFDNSGANTKGGIYDSYKMKFTNQDNTSNTISFEYLNVSQDLDSGSDENATFVTGTDDKFTVFARVTGIAAGINITALKIVSGQKTSTGVASMQYYVYLISKGNDPDHQLEPVGSTRMFVDADQVSEPQSIFSLPKPAILFKPTPVPRSVFAR